jgi:hypothetical protein
VDTAVVAADTAAVVVAADVAIIPTVVVATKRSRFEQKQKYTKPSSIPAGGFFIWLTNEKRTTPSPFLREGLFARDRVMN